MALICISASHTSSQCGPCAQSSCIPAAIALCITCKSPTPYAHTQKQIHSGRNHLPYVYKARNPLARLTITSRHKMNPKCFLVLYYAPKHKITHSCSLANSHTTCKVKHGIKLRIALLRSSKPPHPPCHTALSDESLSRHAAR